MNDLRKAAEMAIEAIMDGDVKDKAAAVYALRQALAQPVDAVNISQECVDETAKCKREWVGLTDDEMFNALLSIDAETKRLPTGLKQFAKAIETKLNEKNT